MFGGGIPLLASCQAGKKNPKPFIEGIGRGDRFPRWSLGKGFPSVAPMESKWTAGGRMGHLVPLPSASSLTCMEFLIASGHQVSSQTQGYLSGGGDTEARAPLVSASSLAHNLLPSLALPGSRDDPGKRRNRVLGSSRVA